MCVVNILRSLCACPFPHARSLWPLPACGTVLSLVISSHFLQMAELYDECIAFFRNNLQLIINSPVDPSCLPASISAHIAATMPDADLFCVEV